MNITIFLIILSLSLLFVFLGYALQDNAGIFRFVGFAFLLTLGVMLMPNTPGSLDFQTGSLITETATGFTIEDTFTQYEDFTIGFYLSCLAIFGTINSYFMLRNEMEDK